MHIVCLNGPNLNRLGKRQPDIYGRETLADVEKKMADLAGTLGCTVSFFQSNHEGELIDRVHRAAETNSAVIINPGGLTHTSVALRDALAEIADGPGFIEVHISNIHAREPFRHHSYLSPIAVGVIAGVGTQGYLLALRATVDRLQSTGAR
ncbi:type II 3-dehydroquinate dehydratase [Corynebacterium mendelii]|uniref:3-dehydroquinate dehydratase n=1 Tax=Corynebacterium mendelii TaxID=2765362 RepID=A0A939DYX8_9CORY|nr:type II 3-dehydroquinate dehydratase [Corynebacterium mendelii]MBN9643406.1 type II 3-dehydroquinate dehydratase [Corynebacterium mendelii]